MTDAGITITQASHVITQPDLKAWFAEHGIDISQVVEATVRLASSWTARYAELPAVHEVNAWLDVTWYKTDTRGRKYADSASPDGGPATGSATIPLTSWPTLTPAA